MTTMREALTKAAEQFDRNAIIHWMTASGSRIGSVIKGELEASDANTAMAKMCRDALAENDAAIKKNEAWLKADLDRTLADVVGWFFRPCAECQWPNICGNANPCTLANLGIDPAHPSRFEGIAGLTADQWDDMVKPRQILPTHRHERSGYKRQSSSGRTVPLPS